MPNTSEGLLAWRRRGCDLVVVPTVYPGLLYTERRLSSMEMLAAMDVPGVQHKAATNNLVWTWCMELQLPFKVRADVLDWVYQLLGPTVSTNW